MRIYYGAGAHAWPSAMPSLTSRSRPRVSLDFFIPCALLTLQYTLNPTLIAAGVGRGAGGRRSARLAERDALADVALAVARQLGLLHAVRVARVQPPLALALALALLPAHGALSSRLRPPQLHKRLSHALQRGRLATTVCCAGAPAGPSLPGQTGAAPRPAPPQAAHCLLLWRGGAPMASVAARPHRAHCCGTSAPQQGM